MFNAVFVSTCDDWKLRTFLPERVAEMAQLFHDVLLLTSERNDNRREANGNKDLSVFSVKYIYIDQSGRFGKY